MNVGELATLLSYVPDDTPLKIMGQELRYAAIIKGRSDGAHQAGTGVLCPSLCHGGARMIPLLINELYAFIGTDGQGQEGIVSAEGIIDGRRTMLPLVGADRERMLSYRPLAVSATQQTGQPIRLVRFSTREELENV